MSVLGFMDYKVADAFIECLGMDPQVLEALEVNHVLMAEPESKLRALFNYLITFQASHWVLPVPQVKDKAIEPKQ